MVNLYIFGYKYPVGIIADDEKAAREKLALYLKYNDSTSVDNWRLIEVCKKSHPGVFIVPFLHPPGG